MSYWMEGSGLHLPPLAQDKVLALLARVSLLLTSLRSTPSIAWFIVPWPKRSTTSPSWTPPRFCSCTLISIQRTFLLTMILTPQDKLSSKNSADNEYLQDLRLRRVGLSINTTICPAIIPVPNLSLNRHYSPRIIWPSFHISPLLRPPDIHSAHLMDEEQVFQSTIDSKGSYVHHESLTKYSIC